MTRKVWFVAAGALAVGFGAGWFGKPAPAHRYCKECGEILALQAKPDRLAVDAVEASNLKAALDRKEAGLAALRKMTGEPPDLHPDCECLCHRYWIGEASRVHDGT